MYFRATKFTVRFTMRCVGDGSVCRVRRDAASAPLLGRSYIILIKFLRRTLIYMIVPALLCSLGGGYTYSARHFKSDNDIGVTLFVPKVELILYEFHKQKQ